MQACIVTEAQRRLAHPDSSSEPDGESSPPEEQRREDHPSSETGSRLDEAVRQGEVRLRWLISPCP